MARGQASHLPRRGARRRQDVRDAQRGPPARTSAAPTSSSASSRRTAGPNTAEQLGDLEVIPRRIIEYRGTTFEEMDVDAVLARRPRGRARRRARAHQRPGSRNEKRWQDVEELLDAGIDVISTVNIQHLESLNDVVERITGVAAARDDPRRGRAPRRSDRARRHDARGAPAAHGARQHLHAGASTPRSATTSGLGNLARAARARAAVARRPGRRGASRSTASATASPRRGRRASGCVVAITGAPGGDDLDPPRGPHGACARTATCSACTCGPTTGSPGPPTERSSEHRACSSELGGEYHEVVGADVAAALVEFARAENAHAARARREPAIALGRAHCGAR